MRYITRAASFHYDDELAITADSVETVDMSPRFSGIYNADGLKLYRIPETVPFGFTAKPRIAVKARSRRF